ncbi:hypothetical protein NMG60_11031309 [Bertholletia excelsa]
MDELRSSPLPPPINTGTTASRRQQEPSPVSRLKKGCLFFAASVQEGFGYLKALLVGQAQKLTARNEKEATEADLRTAKMQVEAADAAEDTKKRLDKSN